MTSKVRSLAAALALTVLMGGAAQALPRYSPQERTAPARLAWFDAAWEWIASRLLPSRPAGESRPRPAGEKEGGMMDPDGAVVSLQSHPEFGWTLGGN